MKTMKKMPKFRISVVPCIATVTAIVSVFMVVKGIMQQPAVSAYDKRADEIRESIEYENQRIEEIDAVIEKVGTDEYIEKMAREKLGMIKSDEIVFVDISGQ